MRHITIGLFLPLIGREGTEFALIEVTALHFQANQKGELTGNHSHTFNLQLSLLVDAILVTTHARVKNPSLQLAHDCFFETQNSVEFIDRVKLESTKRAFFIKGPIFLIIVYEPSFSLFIAFYMSFLRFLI